MRATHLSKSGIGILLLGLYLLWVSIAFPVSSDTIGAAAIESLENTGPTLQSLLNEQIENQQTGPATLIAHVAADENAKAKIHGELIQNPIWSYSGGPSPYYIAYLNLINAPAKYTARGFTVSTPLSAKKYRKTLRGYLRESNKDSVQLLLKPELFGGWLTLAAAHSSAGAPLESAILNVALLAQQDGLQKSLQDELKVVIEEYNSNEQISALEPFYIAALTYSQRFDWTQFSSLAARCLSVQDWIQGAKILRSTPDHAALFYTLIMLSNDFQGVTEHLQKYPGEKTWKDLETVMLMGQTSLHAFLDLGRPLYEARILPLLFEAPSSSWVASLLGPLCVKTPTLALQIKYITIIIGVALTLFGFGHIFRNENKHTTREYFYNIPYINFALTVAVFSLLVIFITEPYIDTQEPTPAMPIGIELDFSQLVQSTQSTLMSATSLDTATTITLLGFFLTQAIIYALCIKKLRSIQEDRLSSKMKLKLLENEENLFDLGLYVGLSGTVASLMLLALGIVGTSLIAAYSSTLFGIISVALLKIVHIRPYRESLLMSTR